MSFWGRLSRCGPAQLYVTQRRLLSWAIISVSFEPKFLVIFRPLVFICICRCKRFGRDKMWTVWIFDSFAIYRCWAFIWQNCFTKYGQALECHNWYVWKPWIWLTRSLWNKQQCQNGIAQIAIKKCSSKVNGFSVIGVLSVAYPLVTLTCNWSFVSVSNRAFQWVSHNALFCKSQTHSDNDSIYYFDWVFLEIPMKTCIVGMLWTCPI